MPVVEDDAAVRMLVVEALKDAGFRVLEAHDGPPGLQTLMSVPDVHSMVTDNGLPGMDGQHLASASIRPTPPYWIARKFLHIEARFNIQVHWYT